MLRTRTGAKQAATIAMAVAFGVVGAACERQTTTTQAPGGTTTTTTVAPAPRADKAVGDAKEVMSDAAITAKVKTALLADDEVKGLKIDVDTNGGVVSLTGALDKPANVARAETVAKGVDGVKSVNNRLTVRPS